MKKWQAAMLSLPMQPPGVPASATPSPTTVSVMANPQCVACTPVVRYVGALRERTYWRTVTDRQVLAAETMVSLQRDAYIPAPPAEGGTHG